MKVRPSVKKICDKCKVIKRKGVITQIGSGCKYIFIKYVLTYRFVFIYMS